jgi:membrane fusion protein (multidrug efflux system)
MADSQHESDDRQPDDNTTTTDQDGKPKRELSGRAKLILLLVALAVVILGALWFVRYQTHGKYQEETNDARIQADAVTIAPRVTGYVEALLVGDNQDVKQGQPLVRINPRDYRAQVAQADAQIAVAAAQADSARAQIREQYATIEQTAAQLAAARTKAAYDASEVARYAPLAASGAETRERLAQLRTTAAQSAADVRAREAALALQQRRVASIESQVRQARAQGQAAEAQRSAADVDLTATMLRAPIAGRVGDKTVTVGQFVSAGTRLMSLVPLDKLYVVANFKETQLALMRVGQPATIKVDALDGTELVGRVESLSPGTGAQFSLLPPQNATGNFTKITQRVPVRIALDATPAVRALLVPGLSVTVTVDTIGAKGDLKRIRDQQDQLDQRAH